MASSNFSDIPPSEGGLEAVLLVDGVVAAVLHFLDVPRGESASFVEHLGRLHGIEKVILLSGDREEEVRRLAAHVGITRTISSASPEEKVDVVRRETAMAETIFFGDGINDAPALAVASVGVAFGGRSEITGEAAGAVLLDPSLHAADELLHIGAHMRRIALQSALGGMALSMAGMVAAAFGFLTPVAGAVVQEGIDLVAVLNALRASRAPKVLADMPMGKS
jgi:P-type E1-E2 ATPase